VFGYVLCVGYTCTWWSLVQARGMERHMCIQLNTQILWPYFSNYIKEPSTLVYFSLFLHKHLVLCSCKHILHRTWPSRKQFICKSRESRHGSRWNANLHTNLLPPPSLSLWKLTMLSPESPPSLLPPHPSLRAPGIHGSTPSTQCRDFFLCPAPAVRVGRRQRAQAVRRNADQDGFLHRGRGRREAGAGS
jgi:hypothetical protein